MNYFLPSWYQDENSWDGRDQVWFRQPQRINFDDTVNQVRMFYQADQEVTLLVPAYFPGLRHFLHQQGILEVPAVSIFDRVQGISADLPSRPLHFQDLPWPDDAELVYAISNLLVYQHGQLTYRLYQGTEGNLVELERLANDQVIRRLTFDDRGFVSRGADLTEAGWRQTYLDLDGNPRLIVAPDGRVTQMTEQGSREYASLTDLVTTALRGYLDQTPTAANVYLAADRGHSNHLAEALRGHNYALSYFYHRATPESAATTTALAGTRLLLADSDATRQVLETAGGQRVLEVPPFDTRLRLGTSNQEEQLKLFLMTTGTSDQELCTALREIIELMEQHEKISLLVAAYDGTDRQRVERVLQEVQDQKELEFDYVLASLEDERKRQAENQGLDEEEAELAARRRSIIFETLDSELKTINLLQPMRLVIDLSRHPDVYLQIAAISAGIPQINREPSMYVDNGKNGLVVDGQPGELTKALGFYLKGLKNWNAALVYTAQKIGTYTGREIVDRIQAAMKGD